ncbi:hypothetical protein IHE49_04975 [Rhodanobacter sp. 7MK24]|uniref:hypothetical protein n=1 Tax=Rhodanobacter sp. 7MK24 TaxID=2775922 RepID=UPI00177BACC1|nr:hypothetical protein [Rhodanobacter sp. 7MK24]MBD8879825.1 hypothetical protein [Rhodanobacter sp. 7MK24]
MGMAKERARSVTAGKSSMRRAKIAGNYNPREFRQRERRPCPEPGHGLRILRRFGPALPVYRCNAAAIDSAASARVTCVRAAINTSLLGMEVGIVSAESARQDRTVLMLSRN